MFVGNEAAYYFEVLLEGVVRPLIDYSPHGFSLLPVCRLIGKYPRFEA